MNLKDVCFYYEEQAYSGVRKIADKVRHDMYLVFDSEPQKSEERGKIKGSAVFFGTVGRSEVLDELARSGKIDLSPVTGKREVYLFTVVKKPFEGVESALVIAGSDKRGAVYGLFHLSELLSVSPFVDWCDVVPAKKADFKLEDNYKYISKEPSVRFRGFFINDEWPAFGNWCTKNFGGFNAKAYEHVFELLLRLKGNYLWPAMWSSRFMDDGPGLENARLADEYGVVMGMSHHEPCLRQGEEYKYLRGKDSIYGDAWNFRSNEAGITKFWEDGLKRSGGFENVITVGMRGEADTAIMGKNAGLADNIELLRDVLKTQRRLIKENVNEDLTQVPRMLALYKEVEAFFYGDKDTKGLMGCKELEDVILMLCDDNFGNMRTLPTEEMRKHKGGYGMYYHFDYHGWPISFEWVNSTYLPKVWEQMTMAYDFGIRDLWIVNVGDICTQEFPLSYFLELAYDFDKWGTAAPNKTDEYTRLFINREFQAGYDDKDREDIFEILKGYTKLAHRRRPEALNAEVYHAVNYNETQETLAEADRIIKLCDRLYAKAADEQLPSLVALVCYPAVAVCNLYKMQLYTTLNHYFAKIGALTANSYIDKIRECMARDRAIVNEYHMIDDGKWYGMGLSEHIGFTRWNEDECQNPVLMEVIPADKPRLRLMIDGTERHAEGSFWLKNKLLLDAFMEPDVDEASFTLYAISDIPAEYEIINEVPWLEIDRQSGVLSSDNTTEQVRIKLHRDRMPVDCAERSGMEEYFQTVPAQITVKLPAGKCTLEIPVIHLDSSKLENQTFILSKDYVSIEAEHFCAKENGKNKAEFKVLDGYGKTLSAVKAFPTDKCFVPGKDAPTVDYRFVVPEAGEYEAELYLQPSNAYTSENKMMYGMQANGGEIKEYNAIPAGEYVKDENESWSAGVLNNIKRHTAEISCKKGINMLRIYAGSPGFVLEKIVIYPKGQKPAYGYLGPAETYYLGK